MQPNELADRIRLLSNAVTTDEGYAESCRMAVTATMIDLLEAITAEAGRNSVVLKFEAYLRSTIHPGKWNKPEQDEAETALDK